MSDGKFFLLVCIMTVLVIALGIGLWIGIPLARQAFAQPVPDPTYPAPVRPAHVTHTFSFLPGQYADLPNRRFRKIEVSSQFPIRVVSGNCHRSYTVEFYCDGPPADIFITDMRRQPLFSSPRANRVTVTATEY